MKAVHKKTLVVDGITPVGAYASLRGDAGEGSFLLESVVPGERWGRYSILGYRPRSKLILHGKPGKDPFAELAALRASSEPLQSDVAARFAGAHVAPSPTTSCISQPRSMPGRATITPESRWRAS